MRNQTHIRKYLTRGAVAAAAAGMAIALAGAPVSATTSDTAQTQSQDGQRMSPETRAAWKKFVRGGGNITGGAAHVVAGAWIGAPSIIVSATGGELTRDQRRAWRHFERGANHMGKGAARVVSSTYVGAPGYVLDQIRSGATPADLSSSELDQVSFLMPAEDLIPADVADLF
ncbi:type III effector [Solicola gregarius]|uniref:Type III effector n=1 Tax=Solicola gregarius TaxID=2908642 RepID=A0AA46TLA5_9ACTN|nr:type III effector [Solicola gregarius]UYM07387.1 type III effector [Solicola gregarius]